MYFIINGDLLALGDIKIFNDPVHGFIRIPRDVLFHIIEHWYFQRLRRIRQLGLTDMVYPGALHTRFHHALGALHLMQEALETLKAKGKDISDEEVEAASIAILLHDIGHGPFSHTLEYSLADISHEELSLLFMKRLNEEMNGKVTTAISIFRGDYHKHFLHQLISGQLDLDRMDYLQRDSFYTGVSEGVIGADRIIKMLDVVNDELVVEAKGIHSIENFLIARRLMYWQVYLHKTVVASEQMLLNTIRRARYLIGCGEKLFATPALSSFLINNYNEKRFYENSKLLDTFALLDDYDIITSIKAWMNHDDRVLSKLSQSLINRNLYKVTFSNKYFGKEKLDVLKDEACKVLSIDKSEASYFVFSKSIENQLYNPDALKIKILYNDGRVTDFAEASDQYDFSVKGRYLQKNFLCYPKEIKSAFKALY